MLMVESAIEDTASETVRCEHTRHKGFEFNIAMI
jgi:hypothetical protein